MSFFSKIAQGLKKTKNSLSSALDGMLSVFTKIDEELFEELEEILIMSDISVNTSEKICDELRKKVKAARTENPEDIKEMLREIITEMLADGQPVKIDTKPSVIVMIGVNGAGKTTTIGKMALRYKNEGKKVILGAADTFRAAAIEQLEVWANRAQVPMIKQKEGSDPAAVVFDTISAAKARDCDLIICDTAGRLHNKKGLMDELNKISRIIDRELPDADRETLLAIDATTGQNAMNQAKEFAAAAGITGIVLTKLDGTAKGGMVLSIKEELGIPVKLVGVGEGIDDLIPFSAEEFAKGII